MTNCLDEDSLLPREYINVNVGKRVRMECEFNNSTINGNRKGLWLRLEDAEVFFYSTSRINSNQRFQIEQRSNLHMINSTLSYELITYSLIIDDIHLSDSGTYSCQIDNRILKLFLLNIVERPYFTTPEYSTIVRTQIGNNISINCQAEGKPQPYLSWIKKSDDNHQKLLINCSTTPTICQLDLSYVNLSHNGIYECVAMNIVGTIGRFYELDVQFPPNVYSLTEKPSHFIGETVILQCLIDANPEPDIRWLHRIFSDVDLTHQYSKEKEDNGLWYIKHEQLNATRWKTSLFIKRIPRRLFNSNFICRAINRYGEDEQSITVVEKYHTSKRHRYTTSVIHTSTIPYNPNQSNTTELGILAGKIENINNRSRRISSYLFILGLYSFLSCFYV